MVNITATICSNNDLSSDCCSNQLNSHHFCNNPTSHCYNNAHHAGCLVHMEARLTDRQREERNEWGQKVLFSEARA